MIRPPFGSAANVSIARSISLPLSDRRSDYRHGELDRCRVNRGKKSSERRLRVEDDGDPGDAGRGLLEQL
jgi:hypothetical protein